MNQLPYRPNVCLLVFNGEKKLFLGERAGEAGIWQLPQGGVEPGSTEEASALREAHEELGVDQDKLRVVKKLSATHQYDFRKAPDYAVGMWRGQRQSFWLIEFLGDDTDIKLDRFHAEFSGWRWCMPQEVRTKAEPIRLPGYQSALSEFEQFCQELGDKTK